MFTVSHIARLKKKKAQYGNEKRNDEKDRVKIDPCTINNILTLLRVHQAHNLQGILYVHMYIFMRGQFVLSTNFGRPQALKTS